MGSGVTMKKILALCGVLAIAPMLVIISCVSTSAQNNGGQDTIRLNTGPDKNGDIFTIQVIDRLDRVLALDMTDRNKRKELTADDWSYDPRTTKLTVKNPPSFINPIYHLEGIGETPSRFVLFNIQNGDSPLVFMDKRVAIEDVDYFWNPQKSLLTMRNSQSIDQAGFYVDYITNDGSACFGDMGDDENSDRIEYALAQKRRVEWKEKIESGEVFPFLEKAENGEPTVVMRKPDVQEKRELLSQSTPIIKARDANDAEISKEVGFDARMPGEVLFTQSKAFAQPGTKMILENASNGTSSLSVMRYYQLSDKVQGTLDDSIPMTLSLTPRMETSQEADFKITSMPMQRAPQVSKTVFWGIRQDERGYTATKMVTYQGMNRGVYFEVTCSTDPQSCDRAEEIILTFLKIRV